jgi:hypothetical protein
MKRFLVPLIVASFAITTNPSPAAESVASYKTANFIVTAPNAAAAREVADAAEAARTAAGRRWFGKEPAAWPRPCSIRVSLALGPTGGATSFDFARGDSDKPEVAFAAMDLRGSLHQLLSSILPHEMTHLVFAHHFGRPLPRWADEGVAILAESLTDQAAHDARCRDLLNEGRGIRLRVLLRMMDYPKDLMATYTQGHSLARFLTGVTAEAGDDGNAQKGPTRFVQFLERGTEGNTAASWDRAAKELYGYESVDTLEQAWLDWLGKSESVLNKGAADRSIRPLVRGVVSGLIPPIELPGSGQPAMPPK